MSETSEREKCSRRGNKLWQIEKKKRSGAGVGWGGGVVQAVFAKARKQKKTEMPFTPMIEVGSAPPNLLIF